MYLAKFANSQKIFIKKMKCCNSMEGKMPIPSKISRATNWFSKSVSSCRKYPWHEFCKGLLFSPIVKMLSNVNPEKACGLDELTSRCPTRLLESFIKNIFLERRDLLNSFFLRQFERHDWNLLTKFWSLMTFGILCGCPLKSSLFIMILKQLLKYDSFIFLF